MSQVLAPTGGSRQRIMMPAIEVEADRRRMHHRTLTHRENLLIWPRSKTPDRLNAMCYVLSSMALVLRLLGRPT
jgi:hypothetical protein